MPGKQKQKTPEGAGIGPRYARRSPWQLDDGIDYTDADEGFQSGPEQFNGQVGSGAKSWSDRGFADDYADNPVQAPGYVKSPRWRGADFVQDEQRFYYTNPYPPIPWSLWPRYANNSTRVIDLWEGHYRVNSSVPHGPASTDWRFDGGGPSGR